MKKSLKCINGLQLKIMAMVFMLCAHLWETIIAYNNWLDCIGRIAFPIFAFLAVEGYLHTKDFKKYILRLLICALISELPFNLMAEGGLIYPFHQNTLFTFCIALLFIKWMDGGKDKRTKYIFRIIISIIGGYFLGFLTMVDYFGYGILMVFVFYLFRNFKFSWMAQLISMIYINFEMMGGLVYPIEVFGYRFEFPQQGLAILSLVFIWLYNGKKGYNSNTIQYACYLFYPVHMIILAILMRI